MQSCNTRVKRVGDKTRGSESQVRCVEIPQKRETLCSEVFAKANRDWPIANLIKNIVLIPMPVLESRKTFGNELPDHF